MSVRRKVVITASGTWTPPAGVNTVDLILVAGGGGGGAVRGGSTGLAGAGGGGGQVAEIRGVRVTPGVAVTCTIGAGGAGGTTVSAATTIGGRGGLTQFGDLVAWGGQGGAGNDGASTGTPQGPTVVGGYYGGMAGGASGSTSRMGGSGGSGHPEGSLAGANVGTQPSFAIADSWTYPLGRHGSGSAAAFEYTMPGSHWRGLGNGGAGGIPAATWGTGPLLAAPNAGGGGAAPGGVGGNAAANKGGGGGGAYASANAGGNGGSGVIEIYYWE